MRHHHPHASERDATARVMRALLDALAWDQPPPCPRQAERVRWDIQFGRYRIRGDVEMLLLTNNEKVKLSVAFVDKYGQPAAIEGSPAWSVSDAALGEIIVSEPGFAAEFVTSGVLGVCQVVVQADADLGDGIRTISGTLDIQIEASEAVAVAISAGAPEPK